MHEGLQAKGEGRAKQRSRNFGSSFREKIFLVRMARFEPRRVCRMLTQPCSERSYSIGRRRHCATKILTVKMMDDARYEVQRRPRRGSSYLLLASHIVSFIIEELPAQRSVPDNLHRFPSNFYALWFLASHLTHQSELLLTPARAQKKEQIIRSLPLTAISHTSNRHHDAEAFFRSGNKTTTLVVFSSLLLLVVLVAVGNVWSPSANCASCCSSTVSTGARISRS